MKKEKIKHIALVSISIMLICVGYMNYSYEPTLEVASLEKNGEENEENIGDVQLVNAETSQSEAIVSNDDENVISTSSRTRSIFFNYKIR